MRLLKNWPYKLLALGVAIVLTSYVHSEQNPWVSVTVSANLRMKNLQDGFVASLAEDKVPLMIEGPKQEVDAIDPKQDVGAWVDLKRLGAGVHSVEVNTSIDRTRAPHVRDPKPSVRTVLVTIEVVSSRTMPVEVRVKNPPPIGYALGAPSVTPSTATVSGAASAVNSVARLVAVIDPSPLRPTVDEYVAIRPIDSRGSEINRVTVAPHYVHVALNLVEAPATKSVFVSANVTGQPLFPYRVEKISANPSSVTIKGRPESLMGVSVISTEEIDLTGQTEDVVRYVDLHVPPGLELQGSRRVKVTIRIVAGR